MVGSSLPGNGRKHVYFLLRSSASTTFLLIVLFAIAVLSGCAEVDGTTNQLTGNLRISGSTALQPLVTKAATSFMQLHPGTHIKVDGGGSKIGLNDVTSRAANIGDSDIYADFAKYPDPNMTDHIVCVIPFAMITNLDVATVKTLTPDQIVGIFSSRQITNWSQVGGPDLAIVPIVRPSSSGTRDTFRKYVLGGRDESPNLTPIDSSKDVLKTVATTPGAIGYLADSVVDHTVNPLQINGVSPSKENIISGHYPFWSYEHMYTLGDDDPLVAAFLEFMLTPTVQDMAKADGYIPIADMKLKVGLSGGTTQSMTLSILKEVEVRHNESY